MLTTFLRKSVRSLDVNVIVAQIFGVPVFRNENASCTRFAIMLYCLLSLFIFNILYVYYEVVDLIHTRTNVSGVTQNLTLTLTHFGGNLKFFNLLFRLNDVQVIIEKLNKLPSHYVTKQQHESKFKSSEVENKLIVAVYSSTVICTCIVGLIALLKDPTMEAKTFPYRVLLPGFLPQAVRIPYMAFGILVLGLQIVAIDSLNILLMNQIRLHLKLLNINLSELTSFNQLTTNPCEFLRDCIQYHQHILRLRNDIEKTFKYTILVQFSTSLLVFVVTGFQAIILTSSEGVILTYFYCSGIFFQLFSYCWFANQVMEENKLLVHAVYDTDWPAFGSYYSQLLLLFMINAQKPLTFSAGGFFNLSLNCFTGILSRSYSYIAVLRQVYAK